MVASKRVPEPAGTIVRTVLAVAGLGGLAGLHAEEPVRSAGVVEISVVYAPEEKAYLIPVISHFNTAYAQGATR